MEKDTSNLIGGEMKDNMASQQLEMFTEDEEED